jgi:transcriptional regulator with XRE-family HTH domain
VRNKTSLEELAEDLGVSASYLSQVRHGTRPPSAELLSYANAMKLLDIKHNLDYERANRYNTHNAEVAQVVEQRTENPRVSSSTLLLGTGYAIMRRGRYAVECFFPGPKLVRGLRLTSERAEVAER